MTADRPPLSLAVRLAGVACALCAVASVVGQPGRGIMLTAGALAFLAALFAAGAET